MQDPRPTPCRRLAAALLLCCAAAGAPAQVPAPAPVPVEAFFTPAKLQQATMSPDGRWLAALTGMPGRRIGFLMIDLDGKEASRFIEASPTDDVRWFRWVGNDWLVFSVNSPGLRSSRRLADGLLAVKRDGTGSRLLIGREFQIEDPFQRRRHLDPDHDFLALGAPGSTEVIVGQWQFRNNEFSHITPKVLDVATGAVRSLLGSDAPRADGWHFDHLGRARVAWSSAAGQTTLWWADPAGKWRQLSQAPIFEQPFVVRALDGDEGLLVSTSARGDGSMELRRYDFAANAPAPDTLVATPGFDSVVTYHPAQDSGALLGVTVLTDAPTPVWFTPAMKEVQAKVDAKFPGAVNLVQCRPCDGKGRLVVHTYSDTDPGSVVLYVPQQDKWLLLGQVKPEIDPRRMAPVDLHRTKARDGRDLPVWITRPAVPAGAAARPAPAVVLVHGGPWLRGRAWEFSAEAQFLASRGYVVIEPEFRGSRGYGAVHYRAGWKQWGRAMQDDVSDALAFAVRQGWADGGRACIMGASYGGYAALMGLVKDPDRYRCGIAHAAVSDPRHMYDFHWSDASAFGREFSLPVMLGDRKKDEALLIAASPLEQVARIKAPLLLSHGGRDRRVPIDNSERMLEALRKAGKPVDWAPYPDEGHSFFYDENRIDYYRRVETFLARHLKP